VQANESKESQHLRLGWHQGVQEGGEEIGVVGEVA
jgi:hypothetical protein